MRPGDLIAGCAYVLLAVVNLPLQASILWIFWKREEFKKYTAYRIMIQMGLLECVLIVFGALFSGLMSLCRSTFFEHFDRVGAAFVPSCWLGVAAFSLLLAINRFLVFNGFKIRGNSESLFYKIFSALIWLIVVALVAGHMFPETWASYNLQYNIYLIPNTKMALLLNNIEYYIITSTLAVTFMLCLATVSAIIVQRSGFAHKVNVSASELRLLVQSVIIFAYLSLNRAALHFAQYYIKTEFECAMLGLFGKTVGLLNPLLFLIFNRKVRQYVLQLIGVFCKRNEFKKLIAFKIMIQMGLLECIFMVVGSLFSGLTTLCETTFFEHFDNVCAAFLAASWIGMSEFSLLLAINRFLVFTDLRMSERWESLFYSTCSLLAWLAVIASFSVHMCPDAWSSYSLRYNIYLFANTKMARQLDEVNFYTITSMLATTFVLSGATVIAIVIQRSGFAHKVNVSSQELRLLTQSVVIFVNLALIRALWHFARYFVQTEFHVTMLGLFGETVGLLNPAFYLLFNRKLRRYVFQMYRRQDLKTTVQSICISAPAGPKTAAAAVVSVFNLA